MGDGDRGGSRYYSLGRFRLVGQRYRAGTHIPVTPDTSGGLANHPLSRLFPETRGRRRQDRPGVCVTFLESFDVGRTGEGVVLCGSLRRLESESRPGEGRVFQVSLLHPSCPVSFPSHRGEKESMVTKGGEMETGTTSGTDRKGRGRCLGSSRGSSG